MLTSSHGSAKALTRPCITRSLDEEKLVSQAPREGHKAHKWIIRGVTAGNGCGGKTICKNRATNVSSTVASFARIPPISARKMGRSCCAPSVANSFTLDVTSLCMRRC